MNSRNNKRWKQEEIDFISKNLDKSISWLSEQMNRSEGSVTTMVWKLKKDTTTVTETSTSKITVTLPPLSEKKGFLIQNNSDKEISVVSSQNEPIFLKPNESKTIAVKPEWKNQIERARQILIAEGMPESQSDLEISYVLSLFLENPSLKNCTPDSIVTAIIDIGRTKTTINPTEKLAYLKERDGKCVFELTYRGLIKTLTDSGSIKIMDAHIVYEDDYLFEYLPAENKLSHKPKVAKTETENNARQIAGAYSVAILKDNTKHYHFMEIWKLEKIERMSDSGSDYFYKEWKPDMYKKCVIRSHFKYLPKGSTLPAYIQRAIMIDEENSSINDPTKGGYGNNRRKKGMMDFFNNQEQ